MGERGGWKRGKGSCYLVQEDPQSLELSREAFRPCKGPQLRPGSAARPALSVRYL